MRKAKIVLRIGLFVVFFYAGADAVIHPFDWVGFVPDIGIEKELLSSIFSVFEIILALWLLWGRWLKYSAILASLALVGIIFVNLSQLDLIFRDFAALASAIALVLLSKGGQSRKPFD